MTKLEKALDDIDGYFRSGNDVPIDKAWIPASKWIALKNAIEEETNVRITPESSGWRYSGGPTGPRC